MNRPHIFFVAVMFMVASGVFLSSGCDSSDESTAPTSDAGSSTTDMGVAMQTDAGSQDALDMGDGDSDGSVPGSDAGAPISSRQAALRSIAANVYRPTFETFRAESVALASAVTAWAETQSEENLEAAKAAWFSANRAWQHAELMQVGPAGLQDRRLGGEGLRDRIYSFPMTNACRVDQEIVAQRYEQEGWVESALLNVQGLDALEYLVFVGGAENACPAAVSINRNGQWAPIAADQAELDLRRSAIAKVLADQIVIHATELANTWSPGSDFAAAFMSGGEPFGDLQTALDQVFAGMFYVDKFIKDLKLGTPAGITPDCEAETCPAELESQHARVSKENLIANLEGFRLLFLGGEGENDFGFDDLLIAEGAAELSDTIIAKTDAAIAALTEIEGTLATALATDAESVRNAHAAVRAITDDLKTQFVTVLNLSVPQEGAGDND